MFSTITSIPTKIWYGLQLNQRLASLQQQFLPDPNQQSNQLNSSSNVESLGHYDSTPNLEQNQMEIIKLNVGGTKFITTRSTLSKSGYFRALLSGNFAYSPEMDQHLFIDLDPSLFGYFLKYMRCDYVSIPSSLLKEMHQGARYLKIEMDLTPYLKQCEPERVSITWDGGYIKVNGTHMDMDSISNRTRPTPKVTNIWNMFGVNKNQIHYSKNPCAFAAYLSRNGYDIISSTGAVYPGDPRNQHDRPKKWLCLITLKKIVPENVMITKRCPRRVTHSSSYPFTRDK